MGHKKPSLFGGSGALEVSCQASAPAEPCEGTLDNPALGQELEAFDAGRSLDNRAGSANLNRTISGVSA